MRPKLRPSFWFLLWLWCLGACVDASSPIIAREGGAGDGGTTTEEDGGTSPGSDASTDTTLESGPTDGGVTNKRDANGPGEAGTECIFNHDCQLALRCSACDAGYCFCEPGTRGTGRN